MPWKECSVIHHRGQDVYVQYAIQRVAFRQPQMSTIWEKRQLVVQEGVFVPLTIRPSSDRRPYIRAYICIYKGYGRQAFVLHRGSRFEQPLAITFASGRLKL